MRLHSTHAMHPLRPSLLALALLLITPLLALAQDTPPDAAAAAATSAPPPGDISLLDLFVQGGLLMYPIALCSIGTIAVAVYAGIRISRRRLMPKEIIPQINTQMAQRDLQAAFAICQQHPSVLTNSLAGGLIRVDLEAPQFARADMERAATDTLIHEEGRLVYWINYLNVFATVAPMLGLLGTVTGMIQAFNMLASGRSEPSDLAGGIGVAMVTTAGGLIVGIPAMFLYFIYRNNLQTAVGDIGKALTVMFDLLTGHVTLGTEHAPMAAETPSEEAPADENPAA